MRFEPPSAFHGVLAIAAGFAFGCGAASPTDVPVTCPGAGDYEYADEIVHAPGAATTPAAIDRPENAINGVVDGRPKSGGLDVFSRGLSADPPNNVLVLRWSDRVVENVAGPDIVVFENAFETAGGVFMDQALVEVSMDGERWVAFPHDYEAEDETRYERNPGLWRGFAGVTPVVWRSEVCEPPFDDSAGGDRFDLDSLDDIELRAGFVFLRLTAAATVVNPDTNEPFPHDFLSDGFDIDGVYARQTR